MSPALITYEVSDGIARLTLNDPHHHNALSAAMVTAIEHACDQAGRDPLVQVLILAANGDYFSSGAPIALLNELAAGGVAPSDIRLARALFDLPIPCVVSLAGHAIGGGFALACAADIMVMAKECRYGLTFMEHGFTPGMGTTGLLEHVLSPAIAHELLYTGECRRGDDFMGSGINYILPRADVSTKAQDIAQRIADKPRAALRLLKRTLSLPRRQRFEATHTLETLMHEVSFATPEVKKRLGGTHVE
jgi:polyketide biosynthesis enoyl-CoA hydratase PksI